MADHPHFNGSPILIGDKVTFRDDDEQYSGRVIQILSRDPVLNVSYKLTAPSGKIGLTSTSVFVDEVISHESMTSQDEPDETAAMAYRRGIKASFNAVMDTELPDTPNPGTASVTKAMCMQAVEGLSLQEPPADLHLSSEYRERERYRQGFQSALLVIRNVKMPSLSTTADMKAVHESIIAAVTKASREIDAIELPDLATPMEKAEVRGYLKGLEVARNAVGDTPSPQGSAIASWDSARNLCYNSVAQLARVANEKLRQGYPMSAIIEPEKR